MARTTFTIPRKATASTRFDDRFPAGHRFTNLEFFAGCGGTHAGTRAAIERAGCSVDTVAVNHNPAALAAHRLNHPDVQTFEAVIDVLEPHLLCPWRDGVDLFTASPSCVGYSSNVSGRPVDEQDRALFWSVASVVRRLRVRRLLMENVARFITAGPCYPKYHPDPRLAGRPIPERAGEEFAAFLTALECAGYRVEWKIQNAADFGVPQDRKRFLLMATLDSQPIVWPEPTHGGPGQPRHRTARDVIDWTNLGSDITTTGARARLADYTRDLIELGLEERGLTEFLIPRKQGKNRFIRSVDRPFMTIVATRPYVTLCQRRRGRIWYRELTMAEYLAAQGFDPNFQMPAGLTADMQQRLIGNAVPPALAEAHVASLLGFTTPANGIDAAPRARVA